MLNNLALVKNIVTGTVTSIDLTDKVIKLDDSNSTGTFNDIIVKTPALNIEDNRVKPCS